MDIVTQSIQGIYMNDMIVAAEAAKQEVTMEEDTASVHVCG